MRELRATTSAPSRAASGLVYVIATQDPAAGLEEARATVARLRALAGVEGDTGGCSALPGILWGFVPADAPGERLTYAQLSGGRWEAALFGDPVWLEPWSGRPCSASELLQRWQAEGAAVAHRLDNLSLVVVADHERGELAFVTDRTGAMRLFEAEVGELRVFTTSYLALSRLVTRKAIDGESLATFFHLGYFPGRRTALRDVAMHPAASITRVRAGEIVTEPYWRPSMSVDRARPVAAQLEGVVDAFNATVREETAGADKVYLAMTAGLDSRSVAASLLHQRVPFETYTHGFRGCWEGKRVARIVRRHRIPHRFVPLEESFVERLGELARQSFLATEGEISAIEKCHLFHVLGLLREDAGPRDVLLLGGGAGMLKGTFYRLLRDEDPYTIDGVDRYIDWNIEKRLPDIFAPDVPARERSVLRRFVTSVLDEVDGGSLFEKLDYLYVVRYRRWAGAVKNIYRHFFPVREPFVSHRLLECVYSLDPAVKNGHLPHFAILARNFPALQYDLTNKMTPALPLNWRTAHRFLPAVGWRTKQVLRGFSRRFLPREIFPLADYVDYKTWIRGDSGRALLEDLLDPGRMQSAFLYDPVKLNSWLDGQRRSGWSAFSLADKMCTLELYFREIGA